MHIIIKKRPCVGGIRREDLARGPVRGPILQPNPAVREIMLVGVDLFANFPKWEGRGGKTSSAEFGSQLASKKKKKVVASKKKRRLWPGGKCLFCGS